MTPKAEDRGTRPGAQGHPEPQRLEEAGALPWNLRESSALPPLDLCYSHGSLKHPSSAPCTLRPMPQQAQGPHVLPKVVSLLPPCPCVCTPKVGMLWVAPARGPPLLGNRGCRLGAPTPSKVLGLLLRLTSWESTAQASVEQPTLSQFPQGTVWCPSLNTDVR